MQKERLRALLTEIVPANRFYAQKLERAGISVADVHAGVELDRLPFTTKADLLADQAELPPYGTGLTYPLTAYTRLHQTSGTTGQPLRWLDTAASWGRLLGCWDSFFRIVGLWPHERLFFPFSFGPFLGFWTAFEAAARLGHLCLAGGGMSTLARLRFLVDNGVTVVFCTPTYALHLAETARQAGIELTGAGVRKLIVAGEQGGSVPATRQRIEQAWNARVFDHYGLTEVGPLAIECQENPAGLHILETEYIAEVIDSASGRPAKPGEVGELVLTNLNRVGSPLVRYRTGDLIRPASEPCPCGRSLLRLEGGILDRTDDMIHLRGNNVYPSALEAVIRRFGEVAEYRVEVDQSGPLAALRIEIEPATAAVDDSLVERVGRAIRDELLFRAEVRTVPPGTLPRFEMKARRVVTRKSTSEA
jgi:phenylacetate-CoA ligase